MADVDEQGNTRSALIDTRRDRHEFEQGHRFLEEKRMLLAQEILQRLAAWREQRAELERLMQSATVEFARVLQSSGLHEIQLARPAVFETERQPANPESFLGVPILSALPLRMESDSSAAALPDCSSAFAGLLRAAAELAWRECNLRRLSDDYLRTERRTRALEEFLLPELRAREKQIEERLDEIEREEAVSLRWFRARRD